jgi:methanethiol S-methyltransferase
MTQVQSIHRDVPAARIPRIIASLYGTVACTAFLVTILYTAGFVMDLAVPKSVDTSVDMGTATSPTEALVVNLILLSLVAGQHSMMAREKFKKWWTQYVPKPVERSTYVLLASVCLVLLFWQWRPMPAIVWQVKDPDAAVTIAAISLAGWAIVFANTFIIDHFELFGPHQTAAVAPGLEAPSPQLRTPYYKLVRHPIYLGLIAAFWAAPEMTVGHLLFATMTTASIFAGSFLGERNLSRVN